MTIKPGKWKMRNGEMAVVEFRTEAATCWHWRGFAGVSRRVTGWLDDGKWIGNDRHEQDLIEPWIDRPKVNWSAMPAWANWVTMDSGGKWFWWAKKPDHSEKAWWGNPANPGVLGSIPEGYHPIFSGDWKDSLVERPSA